MCSAFKKRTDQNLLAVLKQGVLGETPWLKLQDYMLIFINVAHGLTDLSFLHSLSSHPSKCGLSGINTKSASHAKAATKAR